MIRRGSQEHGEALILLGEIQQVLADYIGMPPHCRLADELRTRAALGCREMAGIEMLHARDVRPAPLKNGDGDMRQSKRG